MMTASTSILNVSVSGRNHCFGETTSNVVQTCGCKGIRTCRLCINSDRVSRLNTKANGNYSSKYEGYKLYRYDHSTNTAFLCETLSADSSLAEIQKMNEATSPDNLERLVVPGILLAHNFLSQSEELSLAANIDAAPWQMSQSGRKKQEYGPKVNFKQQKVKLDSFVGIPEYADSLLFKLNELFVDDKSGPLEIVEMCNLEYTADRSSCIEMHLDDQWIWGDRLISINLMDNTIMTLENEAKKELVFILLPKRSILVMSDVARNDYKHGIFAHHIVGRRLAITLREAAVSFKEGGEYFESYGKELSQRSKVRIKTM